MISPSQDSCRRLFAGNHTGKIGNMLHLVLLVIYLNQHCQLFSNKWQIDIDPVQVFAVKSRPAITQSYRFRSYWYPVVVLTQLAQHEKTTVAVIVRPVATRIFGKTLKTST